MKIEIEICIAFLFVFIITFIENIICIILTNLNLNLNIVVAILNKSRLESSFLRNNKTQITLNMSKNKIIFIYIHSFVY